MSRPITRETAQQGSALIVALWVLISLSLLISAFAFDMHIEARVTSFYRKRMKADYLAQAGVEWAKHVLVKSYDVGMDEEGEDEVFLTAAVNLSRGVGISGRTIELGEGTVIVDIRPEQGRYNVNKIDDAQWIEILDHAGVPQDLWDELIDCYFDWVDDNDEHLLNGAESDDSFYRERDYEVKNGYVDTVAELLLIKGFNHSVMFGGPGETEDDPPMLGIARSLTTWGEGKVNVNTASRDVLMTLPGIDEVVVDGLLEQRMGLDGELGTRDDGFDTIEDVMAIPGVDAALRDSITTDERTYVRVTSIGEVDGVRRGIWCVLRAEESGVAPVYWREEQMQ